MFKPLNKAISLPKTHDYLRLDVPGEDKKFKILKSSLASGAATFTFTSSRKELVGEDNHLFMGWGVFKNPEDTDILKVDTLP